MSAADAISNGWQSGTWSKDDSAEMDRAFGGRGGRRVREVMTKDRKYARSPAKGKGFWHWYGGPIQTAPEAMPSSVANLLLMVRDGEHLDREELGRLVEKVGSRVVKTLQKEAKRKRRR